MLSGHLKRDSRLYNDSGRSDDCSEILQALQILLNAPQPLLLAISIASLGITALLPYGPELLTLREYCSRCLRSYLTGLHGLGVRHTLRPSSHEPYWVPTSLAKSAPVRVCPVPEDESVAYIWGRIPSQGFPSLKLAMKHSSRRDRRHRIVDWLALLEEMAEKEEIPDQYLFMFIDNAIAISLDQRRISEIEYSETSSIVSATMLSSSLAEFDDVSTRRTDPHPSDNIFQGLGSSSVPELSSLHPTQSHTESEVKPVTASVAQDTRHERHEVEEASERPPHGVQSLSEHTTDPGAETIGLKVATPMSESLDSVLAPVRSVGGSGSDQSPKDLSPLRDIWKDSDSGAHVVRQASSRGWWQRERGLLQDSHHTIFEENGEDEVGYELPDEKRGRVGPARILKSINDVSWADKEGTEGPQVPMTSAALQSTELSPLRHMPPIIEEFEPLHPAQQSLKKKKKKAYLMTSAALQSKELSPLRHMPPIIEEFEPLHPAQQSLKKKKKKAYLPYPPEGSHVGVHLGGSTGNSELAHAAD